MGKPGNTGLRRIVNATFFSLAGLSAAWRRESAFGQGIFPPVAIERLDLPPTVTISGTLTAFRFSPRAILKQFRDRDEDRAQARRISSLAGKGRLNLLSASELAKAQQTERLGHLAHQGQQGIHLEGRERRRAPTIHAPKRNESGE